MSNAGISPHKETGFVSRYYATQDVKVQEGDTHVAALAGLSMQVISLIVWVWQRR